MATPVHIVRPRKSFPELAGDIAYSITLLAVRGWLVMLLAPLAGFTPGYWQTVGLIYAAQMVIGTDSHRLWTSDK